MPKWVDVNLMRGSELWRIWKQLNLGMKADGANPVFLPKRSGVIRRKRIARRTKNSKRRK